MAHRKPKVEDLELDAPPIQAVPDPILCSPYEEPQKYWKYPDEQQADRRPYVVPGRRQAGYHYKRKRTGDVQANLFMEENWDDLPLVNRLRDDVRRWRESGYRGATEVTKDLLKHWGRADRSRRLFFCQLEAVETIIYLLELRIPGRSSRTGFSKFECTDEDLQKLLRGERPDFKLSSAEFFPKLLDQPADATALGLRRLGCKMATGSGKTVVMSMLVAWAFCNRGRNPSSREFPSAVLICCPNIPIWTRLQVLKPETAGNYYDQFEIVPLRYRDYLNAGKVLITNWHKFGRKSPNSEGGATYRVVDKGEEDNRAFTVDRLGELAQRLPILVLNDEGHHCWRPKVGEAVEVVGDTREEKKAFEQEQEEARVWLDGLDRINNAGLIGERTPCVLAAIDLSATPFYLGGSGHIEGSPFPWLVSDFGLVDAIESGIVKVPRLPVLQEGGQQHRDEAGRPDPKYFRLWHHINQNLGPGDKTGRRVKPEAVYREAQSALITLASQWRQRFEQYRSATSTQLTIPPVMIVVCHETETSQLFYEQLSGEREEEVPLPNGKTETKTVFEGSKILDEFSNEEGHRRTIRIDSKLLAALQGDGEESKDEKVAEMRRIIDTVGKSGMPGEHVRCVVSVSMLTEGWDANNVTQILGVRAFGSQLLCEQVVGRGLRRRSYTPNPDTGLLEPEYVDVYGIPFSLIPFKGRPKDEEEPDDKPRNHVRPVPGREALEIRAPRVESYVYDLRLDGIDCDIDKLEGFVVKEEPIAVYLDAVRGYKDQVEDASIERIDEYIKQDRQAYYDRVHLQAIHFKLTQVVVDRLVAGADSERPDAAAFKLKAKHMLFPQVLRIVQEYIRKRVTFAPGVDPKEIGLEMYSIRLIQHLCAGIVPKAASKTAPLLPVINRMRRYHSTSDAEETTTRPVVPVERSHLNGVIYRSDLEREAAEVLDKSTFVESFTANSRGFGLTVVYQDGDGTRDYEPDFIVRVRGGKHLVIEIKGLKGELHDENLVSIKNQAARKWIAAVNNAKRYGAWEFEICRNMRELEKVLAKHAVVEPRALPFKRVQPAAAERFKTCVPLVPLKVAAGQLTESPAESPTLFDSEEWVAIETKHRLEPGMFVAQVRGKSMETEIPDESWCLFRPDRGGDRKGRILLVAHHDISDPAYSGSYTVKRYRSEKSVDPETGEWRHTKIVLEPLNTTFPPLELKLAAEDEFRVIAEFVEVLGNES
jgi:type III restriction enzyme